MFFRKEVLEQEYQIGDKVFSRVSYLNKLYKGVVVSIKRGVKRYFYVIESEVPVMKHDKSGFASQTVKLETIYTSETEDGIYPRQ